jgi:hypothetical protein
MKTKISERGINASSIFSNNYIDTKNLYMLLMDGVPSITYWYNFNGEKAYDSFCKKYELLIKETQKYREVNLQKTKPIFDDTVVVLHNGCILKFDETYCEAFHPLEMQGFIDELHQFFKPFKKKARREPFEMNVLVKSGNYLEFKAMEIKKTKLNLDLFYNDDFKEVDIAITKRLNQKDDKGIVLLHGLPGAGKTTYLRYLIGKLKKKVIFLSPNMAHSLVDPEFMEMLIDNPNSIVVIEDAENIITDRKISNSSSVSNLLNISDGLLADFLNVQLVCTFNNSLTLVDSALMRKGRLIAKYEFGKLTVDKAQKLSNYFGFKNEIIKPMTIAEIANPNDQEVATSQFEVIGFRRNEEVVMN